MIGARGLSLSVLLGAGIFACGGEPSMGARGPAAAEAPSAGGSADRWGTYRSKRFALVLRLPGGSEWKVDDRSRPELVAIHGPTRSRLVAERWTETDPQNRASCEAGARKRGLLPAAETAKVVEESAAVQPDGQDLRIWVALEPGPTEAAPIRGHAMAVSARNRKCWAIHYVTEVPSSKDDVELSTRLALIRQGTLAHVDIEGLEEVPREQRTR